MLDAREIDIEIARLEYGESSYPAYAKLADLYTIRNQMRREESAAEIESGYSAAAPPETASDVFPEIGDSDFFRLAAGKNLGAVLGVLDELLETLKITNPRAYASVMRKIQNLG